MRTQMQAIQVNSAQGFSWMNAAVRAYGRHAGLWVLIGLIAMLISFVGLHTNTLSTILLFFEPMLIGLFFYIAHRTLSAQTLTAAQCLTLIKKTFFRWLGLGILLAISSFLIYLVIFFLFMVIASSLGAIQIDDVSTLIATPVVSWFPDVGANALFIFVSAVILIFLTVLIQTIILYAPALLIARDLDYQSDMSMGQSLFSSCVGTMINWRPLFVNTVYMLVLLVIFFSIASLLLVVTTTAVMGIMIYPLLFYCLVVPILLLNLYYSFRAIFIDPVPALTHDSEPDHAEQAAP